MDIDIVEVIKNAVEPLIKSMVDFPDDITISIQKSEFKTIFVYITGKQPDVGKLIGREGRHVGAIRLLLSAIGSKHRHRVIVEIEKEQLNP